MRIETTARFWRFTRYTEDDILVEVPISGIVHASADGSEYIASLDPGLDLRTDDEVNGAEDHLVDLFTQLSLPYVEEWRIQLPRLSAVHS